MKTLIVGIDALDYGIFRARAPSYSVLPLYSPVPVTGPAWFSIYTGMTLEHHGVRDVWGRRRELPGFGMSKSYQNCQHVCFWDTLDRHHIRSGLFGLPACHPPHCRPSGGEGWPGDGWHIAGCGANPDQMFCPPWLTRDIAGWQDVHRRVDLVHRYGGEYPEYPDWPGAFAEMSLGTALLDARTDALACLFTAKSLLQKRPVDVLFLCFTFVDRFLHERAWGDEVEAVYILVDTVLDAAERYFKPDTTMIVSDHGGAYGVHTDMGVFAYKGDGLVALPASDQPPAYGEPLCLPNPTDADEVVEKPWLIKVDVGPQVARPYVYDVAPTICALMGADMQGTDGRAIREILQPEDMTPVAERLYQLGYAPKPEETTQ
jgi:hypothetical protein